MNTYKKHPEARNGEVCLGFVSLATYKKIGWKTKRLGENVPQLGDDIHPIFVEEKELEEAGVWEVKNG